MSDKPLNPSAFPSPGVVLYSGEQQGAYEGMTLRDYFAAKVMHAECNTAGMDEDAARDLVEAATRAGQTIEQRIAFNAYAIADAMLAEREK